MPPLDFPKPAHLPPSKRRVPKRWIRDPSDERAKAAGCWFDERFVDHFREFGRRYLRHWEGRRWAGKPFELLDWQLDFVFGPLFGWFRFDDELGRPVRRFNRCYVEVPKKNGKSPMGAYVGAYILCADSESGAKVFSAATAKDQAAIVHNHAIQMIRAAPELEARTKVNRTTKSIHYAPSESYYSVISSDGDRQEGLNGNACIIDELHVWRGRELWDALRWMFASRDEPILFAITTAGNDMQSVCRAQHDYALRVASGEIEDQGFLGYIAAADDDDDPGDPAVWAKANPSLGHTFRLSEIEESYNEAKDSPALLASFKRYRLNIWQTAETPWLEYDRWFACGADYTAEDLQGLPCYAGLDLAKTRDMTALVLCFVRDETFALWPYFWLPEETARNKSAPAYYRTWEDAGLLETTPGDTADYAIITERIVQIVEQFQCASMAYDPWNAASVVQRVESQTGIEMKQFGQTVTNFAYPTKEFERLVLSGGIEHPRHDVLSWQAQHVQVWSDASGNLRPIKPKHGDHRKIDGIVAAIMALALALAHDGEEIVPYEEIELPAWQ